MTSKSNAADSIIVKDVAVHAKTSTDHTADENGTANICFAVSASSATQLETNKPVNVAYDHHVIASKTTSAPPMTQIKSNGNTAAPSTVKPILLMTPNAAMNMKSFNFNQLAFPIHEIQGVQLAMPSSNQPLKPVSVVPTTEVAQPGPATSNAAHDQPRPKVTIPAPTTALSAQAPLTPSTPIEKDPFELNDRIPITCRKNNAMFDRRKLGSGQRGKCILFENCWITPSEFEVASGLSMSRDWKRSLRYGGFTFQKLINEGFLKPHSALCTCAICSDDDSVTSPIRLFQPYKRRKRSSTTSSAGNFVEKKPNIEKGKFLRQSSAGALDSLLNNLHSKNPEAESAMRVLLAESQIAEQRTWWQLEEISNNLLQQAQRLTAAVAEAKTNSLNQRVALVQKLMSHYQKDQVLDSSMLIGQVHSGFTKDLNSASIQSGVLVGDNQQKVQLAFGKDLIKLEVANSNQFCITCGNQAVSECTGCYKATYCSTACQEKDWLNGHADVCQASKVAEQTLKDKAEKALVVTNSASDVDSLVVMPTASVLPNSESTQLTKNDQIQAD